MNPWSTEWKQKKLDSLYSEWNNCKRCRLHGYRAAMVYGQGNVNASILLVGDIPNEDEDRNGKFFSGESGVLLYDLLDYHRISVEDVYITNLVMCRTPCGRDPNTDEMTICFERLREEIYIIDPVLIILLGRIAYKFLSKTRTSMEPERGELVQISIPGNSTFGGNPVQLSYDALPVYHPSYILRNDSIDPKTNRWKNNGAAYRTLDDIKMAVHLVSLLHEKYRVITNELRRVQHASGTHQKEVNQRPSFQRGKT